jgi:KDEL-tailed cysteine endopeptidase
MGAVTEPRDQSKCGSCWAFTTASTLEALAVISGKYKEIPTFSMQQLLDCDNLNDGCDGGWMYKAYNYTRTNGIMLYDDYPYKMSADHSKCLYNSSRELFRNGGMIQEKNIDNKALKAIVSRQPVGVGIRSNSNFQFYKTGIMTEEFLNCSDPNQGAVNHGVAVVGYGKTKGDEKMSHWCEEYWIVRNTWGTNWGENGFVKLCMDGYGSAAMPYGICQLNRYPTYPTMENHPVEVELLV